MITSGAGVTVAFAAVRNPSASFSFSSLLFPAFVGMVTVEIGFEEVGVTEVGLYKLIVEELSDTAVRGEFLVADTNGMLNIDNRNMLKKRRRIL